MSYDDFDLDAAIPGGGGWIDDPAAVAAVAESLPMPTWGDTPASALSIDDTPTEVLGWRLANSANGGKPFPWGNQGNCPSCVSFGTAHAILLTLAAEKLAFDGDDLTMPAPEVIYGGSRVQIGGGRLRGGGSIGAWAGDFVQKFGFLPQTKIGSIDLSTYSIDRCNSYGRSGVPKELLEAASGHTVAGITQIRNFNEACCAMAQGFFIAVCSNRGFVGKRDDKGFIAPRGTWNHCMGLAGYRRTGRAGGFILNSWGPDAHMGGKSHPDMPTNGFWVEADVLDRMFAQDDTWAFSRVNGFQLKQPAGG